jgi:hypothetical protein
MSPKGPRPPPQPPNGPPPKIEPGKFYLIEGHVLIRISVLARALELRVETQEPMSHMELLDSIRHIADIIPIRLPEAF